MIRKKLKKTKKNKTCVLEFFEAYSTTTYIHNMNTLCTYLYLHVPGLK